MFDQIEFLSRIGRLITMGQERQAERDLLAALSALTPADDTEHRIFLFNQLAQLYSLPTFEDLPKAEGCFLQCEALSPEPPTLLQTAMFYFCARRDFSATVSKVDEFRTRWGGSQGVSYYSAMALKGQALIELGDIDGAGHVLDEMSAMVRSVPSGLPYGDELNFLESAVSRPSLAERCCEVLRLTAPRIRSQEYADRAMALLAECEKQGNTGTS
jgi:hypothetical protein